MEWWPFVVGFFVGVLTGAIAARSRRPRTDEKELSTLREENERLRLAEVRLTEELRAEREKLGWVETAKETLRDAFAALAHEALSSNADQFLTRSREQLTSLLEQLKSDWGTQKEELKGLVSPLEKSLSALDGQIRALEEKREGAYRSLERHLSELGKAQSQLHQTTITLAQALRSPTIRGRWGEVQLRRVLELAGMAEHVDFSLQVTTDEGRPDAIVHLPNEGVLPIDAKTPMSAYFDAVEGPEERVEERLAAHAKAMQARIQELGRKEYWSQFEHAPEMVVMFVPSEAALAAAFQREPKLLEYGIDHKVLVATPTILLALLRSVAYGWQQHQIAENAREIANQGRELYQRILNILKPFRELGTHIGKAADTYDQAVASLERRLLPSLNRFKELNAIEEPPPKLKPLDRSPRLPLENEEEGD